MFSHVFTYTSITSGILRFFHVYSCYIFPYPFSNKFLVSLDCLLLVILSLNPLNAFVCFYFIRNTHIFTLVQHNDYDAPGKQPVSAYTFSLYFQASLSADNSTKENNSRTKFQVDLIFSVTIDID